MEELKSAPKRAYNFTTIEVVAYPADSDRPLTKQQLRQLLGISTRKTMCDYVKDLELTPINVVVQGRRNLEQFNWQHVREMLGAKLWVQAGHGNNSRKQWKRLQERKLGELALKKKYGLSLEQEFNRLKEKSSV